MPKVMSAKSVPTMTDVQRETRRAEHHAFAESENGGVEDVETFAAEVVGAVRAELLRELRRGADHRKFREAALVARAQALKAAFNQRGFEYTDDEESESADHDEELGSDDQDAE